ncbi:phBC6A51 family helix-turn-helix protein [Aeribacillus composti]|uniref:phBC6A51 family helix-turn-helix protein n=1 Tax=Aeribacillus composti TaxID=1868734 RepID=UPI002E1AFF52|nr:phBC6A51 family helix-turn-helix protein [Aeribacillus composti]
MYNEKLTQQQIVAAQLLASGELEKKEIAKQIGISRQTLYNWINKDENFKAEVDRLRLELKSFGEELIAGKLVEAVKGYWDLIESTNNARVKAEGYRYFIDRNLGKPTSKLDIEAGMKENDQVDEDILEAEFDEWENDVE